MIKWIITTLGLYLSWIFIDLSSESFLQSKILPFVFLTFLITFLMRLALRFDGGRYSNGSSSGGYSSYGGCDGGSDAGGGE